MRFTIVQGPQSVQGSEAWLEFRKDKISASMAPSIMGVNPYCSRLQLWEGIMFNTSKPKTAAMQRGNDLEQKARDWLNMMTGRNYIPVVVQSVAHPEFIASLDGYWVDEAGKIHIAEIKCPGTATHARALEDEIPEMYYPQLQHQMDIVGVDETIYLSFDGEEGVMLPCLRDQYYCASLFAEELAFAASLIMFKPPEATDRDWVEIVDSRAIEKADRYKKVCTLIDTLEIEKEALKESLIEETETARSVIGDLKIQKVTRKGNLDYDRMIKDYDIHAIDRYRKPPIESYRFTFS